MADDGIWTTNAAIVARAGINASATAAAIGETDKYVLFYEAMVNVATRKNWSDFFVAPGFNDDVLGILQQITTAFCAIEVIKNDMSGFTSLAEAESMIVTLRDAALRDLSILREQEAQDFIADESP